MRKRYPEVGGAKRKLRESQIEGFGVQCARNLKYYCRKYKTPARRSAPDRIFAKHGRVFFIEFKATGCVPSDLQDEEHRIMRAVGLTVYVVDSKQGFLDVFVPEDQALEWLDLPSDREVIG